MLRTGRIPEQSAAEKDQSFVKVPPAYNYVAAFLTLSCNQSCEYCINRFHGGSLHRGIMEGAEWVRCLNRLLMPPDLPVTLQGGEPTLHPDFYDIIRGLRPDIGIDILTNLRFDVREFMRRVPPERISRSAKYASIRVSYHSGQAGFDELKEKVILLKDAGYSVGIWAIRHPDFEDELDRRFDECLRAGIDFRFKEFLGYHKGRLYGTFKYPGAVSLARGQSVRCRTTELLIGPYGDTFRCHSDLYNGRPPTGNIRHGDFTIRDIHRPCGFFGFCNPCDVKVKFDRFQKFGHTSVIIRKSG